MSEIFGSRLERTNVLLDAEKFFVTEAVVVNPTSQVPTNK